MAESHTKPLYPSYPPLPSPKILKSRSPQRLLIPRQPHIARTNSNSKSFKKTSVDKSIREKEIQQQLRYAKPTITEYQFEGSFVNSQGNMGSAVFPRQLQDSQETVQRIRTHSRQKSSKAYSKRQLLAEKGDSTKNFDILSGVSATSPQRRLGADKNEQYYVYWKNKAHQYLESNMKLMEDIRRLTRDNEQLKEQIQNLKSKQKLLTDKSMEGVEINEKELHNQIRKVSVHYIDKIQSMEKELKKKEIVINSYEIKLGELNSRISGDYQRIKLMNKMKQDLERLQTETRQYKTQNALNKEETRFSQSGVDNKGERGITGKFQTPAINRYYSPKKK